MSSLPRLRNCMQLQNKGWGCSCVLDWDTKNFICKGRKYIATYVRKTLTIEKWSHHVYHKYLLLGYHKCPIPFRYPTMKQMTHTLWYLLFQVYLDMSGFQSTVIELYICTFLNWYLFVLMLPARLNFDTQAGSF